MKNSSYTKKVVLLKPHRHENRERSPGDELTLAAQVADWLIGLKVAKPVSVKQEPTPELTLTITTGTENV